ncbi:MAG: hypothetical protein HY738_15620 [Bacteroidia bacterium]|nr:hypothetical protein [Bacteroidia bacterium]
MKKNDLCERLIQNESSELKRILASILNKLTILLFFLGLGIWNLRLGIWNLRKGMLLFALLYLVLSMFKLYACEIEFEVQGEKKEKYKTGDELIVIVKVAFTHKVCEIVLQDTKFEAAGLIIESATDWKETSPGEWERKLKIKVTGSEDGKLTLTATRSCSKEGGFGSLTLLQDSK